MPSAVAVKPGETVVWIHPETTDAHNVKFDDLSIPDGGPPTPTPAPFTASRTFNSVAPTPYRYFCEEHGGPNGVGMSGVVYVTADGNLPPGAPTAALTAEPASPQPGQSITLNAGGSSDPNGSIVKYEWDLDGNGNYETDTSASPTISQAYPAPGPRTARVRVTDNQGLIGEAAYSFTVASPPSPSPSPSPPSPVTPLNPITAPVTGSQPVQPAQLPPVSSKIRLLSSKRLKNVLRRGLRFEAGVPSNGAGLRATLSARGRTLGTLRRTNLSRGRVKLTLKLSRRGKTNLKKLLGKRRRIATVMKVTTGNTTSRARVTLSR